MQKCYKISFNFVVQKQPKYYLPNGFLRASYRVFIWPDMISFIYKCKVSLPTNLLYLNFIILHVNDLHWLYSSTEGKPDHTSWVLIVSRLGHCFSGCHLKACGASSLWSLFQLQILCPDRLLTVRSEAPLHSALHDFHTCKSLQRTWLLHVLMSQQQPVLTWATDK